MNARINFGEIASRVDLPKLIESLKIEVRNGKALCPFHQNTETPAMGVFLRGDRWRFLCHNCGAKGDAIGFYAAYQNISMIEAARQLGGIDERRDHVRTNRPSPEATPTTEPAKLSAIADPAWQQAVEEVITRAEELLWSADGVEARDWLRSRGLADHTITRFRLGFIDRGYETQALEVLRGKDGRLRPIYAPRGITLPWIGPGCWHSMEIDPPGICKWVGCNVRKLMPDVFEPLLNTGKCLALLGSVRGYAFPWSELLPSQIGPPALILEGEFDALLAFQEIGHIVHAVTVGGSSQAPHQTALDALSLCPSWFLALDHDEAGIKASLKWRERSEGKARRVLLPVGKDVGDFVQRGGDLGEWIVGEIKLANDEFFSRKELCHPRSSYGSDQP